MTRFSDASTSTNRAKWLIWFVATCHLLLPIRGDDSAGNATSIPQLDFEPALTCESQDAYSNQDFVTLLGGRPGSTVTGSTGGSLLVPQDMPIGPSCGNVVPSGHGFWFPIQPETQGQIEMIDCTNSTAVTMVPIVYTAPREFANTTTNCDELYCVAEGISDPLRTTEPIRSEGTICPNANSYDGVRFTATEDQFYFVYVHVTSETTTELSNLQVTTMVSELAVPNDYCSGAIELTLDESTQTITTDDFVNVHTDLVPRECESCNSLDEAEASPIVWTDEWKGVWYTLPYAEMYIDPRNNTLWGVDMCASTSQNVSVSFYRGTDCENLVHVGRVGADESSTCSYTMALPVDLEDPSKIYYMFVYSTDLTMEGPVTVKMTLGGASASSSAGVAGWWGILTISLLAGALPFWLL